MYGIYDNGCQLLGKVIDIKEYACKNCENYEEVKEIIEDLENYDSDNIVCVDYDNPMGYRIINWNKKDKFLVKNNNCDWKKELEESDYFGLLALNESDDLKTDEQKNLCSMLISMNLLLFETKNGYDSDIEFLYQQKKTELLKELGYEFNDCGKIVKIKEISEEEKAIKELGIGSYVNYFQWKRFKDLRELKGYIINTLDNYYLSEIAIRTDYDNNFQDYEINGTIEDKYLICDFTLYYVKTRNNEFLITEASSEISWK